MFTTAVRLVRALLALLALCPGAGSLFAQTPRPVRLFGPLSTKEVQSRPPVLTTDLPTDVAPLVGELLVFRVTVTDPDGDRVSLRLTNPPPGMQFQPVLTAPSPLVHEIRWRVAHEAGGFRKLVFQADDGRRPHRVTRLEVELRVDGQCKPDHVLTGDVTGDGVPDAVVGAQFAGVNDTGAIHVWSGASVPSGTPTATLVAAAGLFAKLGDLYHLATDDQAAGQGIQLVDLTGDGVLDVVAGAWRADVASTVDTGALFLWSGGAGLTGTVSPTATLAVPGASAGDSIGLGLSGQTIQVVDVTADGQLDLVVTAAFADPGGIADAGAVHVWAGGGPFVGTVAPTATLAVAGAAAGDGLGFTGINPAQGVRVADVTGDGRPDVIVGASVADVGGVSDAGALYVWAGGAGLVGTPAPTATLTVPGAATGDQLCEVRWGQPVRLADVTSDGTLDLVVGAILADGAAVDVGAVYVWHGGPTLLGLVPPHATLIDPAAAAGDRLGFVETGSGIRFADVTADGTLDVVVGSSVADTGGVTDAGVIHVWHGRAGLLGVLPPDATLFLPAPTPGDRLGWLDTVFVPGIQFSDVTGDGVLDVVAGASGEDVAGVPNAGAIHVWTGGPGLVGPLVPTADLVVPGASSGDQLGFAGFGAALGGHGMSLVDVSGDGLDDIVVAAPFADVGGLVDAGAVYVWNAGPGLTGAVPPTATLTVPGAVASDRLAFVLHGHGLLTADVTGDGVRDLVATATQADFGGVVDCGVIHVWAGGGLVGTVAPSATLTVSGASPNDFLGLTGPPSPVGTRSGHAVRLEEVTGDGCLDVIAGAMGADRVGLPDAGALYVWKGGPGLSGLTVPSSILVVPGAAPGDLLGASREGQGIRLADVTGDAIPELVVTASFATTTAPGAGAVYIWVGPLAGSVPPLVGLVVPGAFFLDTLGL